MNNKVLFLSFTVSLGGFLFGFDAGIISGVMNFVGPEFELNEFHTYSDEWEGSDLVYRLDDLEVYRNENLGENYPEPMFAILNFAKITDNPMQGEWVMELDCVKHEHRL